MKPIFFFRSFTRIFLPATILCLSQLGFAQAPAVPDTSKMTYNQISSSLKLYVFPAKKQSKQQQKVDEFECYNWAVGAIRN
jgi:hypothetical protein